MPTFGKFFDALVIEIDQQIGQLLMPTLRNLYSYYLFPEKHVRMKRNAGYIVRVLLEKLGI